MAGDIVPPLCPKMGVIGFSPYGQQARQAIRVMYLIIPPWPDQGSYGKGTPSVASAIRPMVSLLNNTPLPLLRGYSLMDRWSLKNCFGFRLSLFGENLGVCICACICIWTVLTMTIHLYGRARGGADLSRFNWPQVQPQRVRLLASQGTTILLKRGHPPMCIVKSNWTSDLKSDVVSDVHSDVKMWYTSDYN